MIAKPELGCAGPRTAGIMNHHGIAPARRTSSIYQLTVIEVSLRIGNTKHRRPGPDGHPVDHAQVRFRKRIPVESLPKPGEPLTLPTATGTTLPATVVQVDWIDDKELFVVACRYAARSISLQEYEAVINDPDWVMTPLL